MIAVFSTGARGGVLVQPPSSANTCSEGAVLPRSPRGRSSAEGSSSEQGKVAIDVRFTSPVGAEEPGLY